MSQWVGWWKTSFHLRLAIRVHVLRDGNCFTNDLSIVCIYILLVHILYYRRMGDTLQLHFLIVQHNYHPHLYGIYIYIWIYKYIYIHIHIMLHVTCLPKLSTSFQVHLGQRCGRVARPIFLPRISVGLVGREKPWVTQVMSSSLFT